MQLEVQVLSDRQIAPPPRHPKHPAKLHRTFNFHSLICGRRPKIQLPALLTDGHTALSRFAVMTGPQIKSDSKYDDYDYPTTSPEVKNGHPGHTTPEQDAQVFQLRSKLESAGFSERLDTLCMVRRLRHVKLSTSCI